MGASHIKLNKRASASTIQLGVVGFEANSRTAINLFFLQHSESYNMVPTEHAEVLIVDMEHPAVAPVIEQYRDSRPIVAVTATEQSFAGFETIRKPLEGKVLIKAVKQAVELFVPGKAEAAEDSQTVSSEGEKAFQEYQKRLAAGRQAIADYQVVTTDREQQTSQVRQRFTLGDQPETKAEQTPLQAQAAIKKKTVAEAKKKTLKAKPVAKQLPLERKAPEKKPQEVKAKLSYQMVYECCGNAPDVNMSEPEQRRRVFFKDDSTLLAILQEVIAEGEAQQVPVEITGLPGTLAYLPARQSFLFDFNEDLLVPLALTRFGYQELTLKVRPDLDDDEPSIGGAKLKFESRDELIWKLALWTSKGRLNRLLDPEKPHRLAKEIDFERLLAIPHASTISSLWGRHSLSALEVVKVLKINQRYVFSFMTAAHALGAFK